jgi:hypothetical protein
LLSAVQQWLVQLRLPANCELEAVAPVAISLAKGETFALAIAKVRSEIFALSQQLAKVRAAPLPTADQIKLAEEYVARRGAVTGPRIGVVRDQLQLQWHDDVIASRQDLIGTLCWLAPASVLSALKREIEAAGAPVNAMPAAERINRISELEAQLLALERREEVLISCAAVDGTEVLRRPDANPMAVLGVVIVRSAQEAAASAA